MFSVPFEIQVFGLWPRTDGGWLELVCSLRRVFCSDHLVVKKGVGTCESCAVDRERREASGGVSAADEDRLVLLLRADVEATIGPGHDEAIVEVAARHRLHATAPACYFDQVVGDVQQYFHDTFVDTTWPSCPHHSNHPLWFSGGWWRCERIEEPIARLGALSGVNREREG